MLNAVLKKIYTNLLTVNFDIFKFGVKFLGAGLY